MHKVYNMKINSTLLSDIQYYLTELDIFLSVRKSTCFTLILNHKAPKKL